ncbi:MAG: tryptophan 2,3-dioxygenase [Granulosicoccaceae bacterium]
MSNKPYDPTVDGAEVNFSEKMSYIDYLGLDKILSAQNPLSEAHDEMLFIIQHQTSELWMRLALHELYAARAAIRNDHFPPAFKMLSRVSKIFEQLNNAWDVLRTMTPSEYTEFRDDLAQSSGFQSHQYRLCEYVIGNRNKAMIKPHAHRPDLVTALEDELKQHNLYQEVIFAMARAGYTISEDALGRHSAESYVGDKSVELVWKQVYEKPEDHWKFYELGEKLVDFEDYFRRWRFNHVTTVERIIGFKHGTGGTAGVSYLKQMLEVQLFPELWSVRTVL